MPPGEKRLSAEDWANAALTALSEGGLAAVAVEPLAKRLGTTKGSFYWHFKNRDALIAAALRRWEEVGTELVIAEVEAEPDPVRRVRRLFDDVMEHSATGRVELSLMASAGHPVVGPALSRIAERRIEYVSRLLRALPMPAAEARRRAVVAVGVYHGFNQLTHTAPDALPTGPARRRALIASVVDILLSGYAPTG